MALSEIRTDPPNKEYDDVHPPRIRSLVAGFAIALVLGAAQAPTAVAQENPFQRGPDPTNASIEASRGTFTTTQSSISSLVPGFGGGVIYYPTSTTQGTFGAVAISPGFTASWSSLSWLGPRLASFGFVVVGIETNSRFDQPNSRGEQLLAALDWAVNSSPAASRIDRNRLAVAGHSMGGGGSLAAANMRPSLQAAIPLAPWHTTKIWPTVRVPTLIIGGESDSVAPVSSHSEPFYNTLTGAPERAYLELNNASHFFPQTANVPQARMMISWLKAFVDNDTRYLQFLCPGPVNLSSTEEYRNTCPMTV
jgi:pimeloyl-ACP methyl ester carboxylesterase